MTAPTDLMLPQKIWLKLRQLRDEHANGTLELNIKDGVVHGYKVTETGRIDEPSSARSTKG